MPFSAITVVDEEVENLERINEIMSHMMCSTSMKNPSEAPGRIEEDKRRDEETDSTLGCFVERS